MTRRVANDTEDCKVWMVFEPSNDAAPQLTLAPETRKRFVRALAEMVLQSIHEDRSQHGQTK